MTDDSAPLRAMVSRAIKDAGDKCYGNGMSVEDACDVLADAAIAVCQSSWAKEKAKLEQYATEQLSNAQYAFAQADKLQEEKAAIERERDDACAMMEREITRCDELEQQRDDAEAFIYWNACDASMMSEEEANRLERAALERYIERHASRPVTVKD